MFRRRTANWKAWICCEFEWNLSAWLDNIEILIKRESNGRVGRLTVKLYCHALVSISVFQAVSHTC